MARAPTASPGDDRLVLELGEGRYLERLELPDCLFDLVAPARIELVPVLVVEAASLCEQLAPPGEGRLVGHRVRAEVAVAVEDAVLDSEGGGHHEEAGARLADSDRGVVERHGVEREDGLREVDPVREPEAAVLGDTAILAEDGVAGVQLLPPVAARWDRHVERARKAHARCLCHGRQSYPRPRGRHTPGVAASSAGASRGGSRARGLHHLRDVGDPRIDVRVLVEADPRREARLADRRRVLRERRAAPSAPPAPRSACRRARGSAA